jgi:hypothetical protein
MTGRCSMDGFDPAGRAAEIVLAVLAWAAKTERFAINERIAAARRRIEAEGGVGVGPGYGRTPRSGARSCFAGRASASAPSPRNSVSRRALVVEAPCARPQPGTSTIDLPVHPPALRLVSSANALKVAGCVLRLSPGEHRLFLRLGSTRCRRAAFALSHGELSAERACAYHGRASTLFGLGYCAPWRGLAR